MKISMHFYYISLRSS